MTEYDGFGIWGLVMFATRRLLPSDDVPLLVYPTEQFPEGE